MPLPLSTSLPGCETELVWEPPLPGQRIGNASEKLNPFAYYVAGATAASASGKVFWLTKAGLLIWLPTSKLKKALLLLAVLDSPKTAGAGIWVSEAVISGFSSSMPAAEAILEG